MSPNSFAALEGFDSHESRKKRLGQYFSGLPVSKLLVALCARRGIHSVCDPMAGRGDMLVAAQEILPGCKQVDGIEIDPLAHSEATATLRAGAAKSKLLLGSAFDWAAVSKLAADGYDLVATNPPYVRYQSQKTSAGQTSKLPNALEVRNGLRECLLRLETLSDEERLDFLSLAENYSGLSDLAVPSWILCAALVKSGGTLAMVVPEAWLSRDYASVVQYLLLRWFRIEFIVEDAHAAWFSDAQVKTNLLVARRIKPLEGIGAWKNETYLHISLPSALADAQSLVGRCDFASKNAEVAFAKKARRVAEARSQELVPLAAFHRVRLADQVSVVSRSASAEQWFQRLEPKVALQPIAGHVVPPMLANWFDGCSSLTTLDELGYEVGQGLRTGANGFFYADVVARRGTKATVESGLFKGEQVVLPKACALPVVRKQADIGLKLSIDADSLQGTALAFHGWALPEDAESAGARPLDDAAASYIRRAAKVKIGDKVLPSLSAVAPNVRKANSRTGAPARFWYMLPDFAPRHRPDLFIARVNSEAPRVTLNPGRKALVDANFSTLWAGEDARVETSAIFAYLNSSVAVALFEYLGSVMGGGALKLEATHLRALPVPELRKAEWDKLAKLGTKLVAAEQDKRRGVVQQIDEVLCKSMFGNSSISGKVSALNAAISTKQAARKKSYDRDPRDPSATVPR